MWQKHYLGEANFIEPDSVICRYLQTPYAFKTRKQES